MLDIQGGGVLPFAVYPFGLDEAALNRGFRERRMEEQARRRKEKLPFKGLMRAASPGEAEAFLTPRQISVLRERCAARFGVMLRDNPMSRG